MGRMRLMGESKNAKSGFTVIEVMLFLAITGMLLIGVLGGTYLSISSQRYNDSVRSFAEFLRQLYAEVISPESLGNTNGEHSGNSDLYAIYGKVAVFGLNNETTVYTATLIGDVDIPVTNKTFIEELGDVHAKLFCGSEDDSGAQDTTVDSYEPLWLTQINNPSGNLLKGTLIIARSPTSGTVHTVFRPDFQPDLAASDGCRPGTGNQRASNALADDIQNHSNEYDIQNDVNFCLKSENSSIIRDIVVGADGHNNTAINILDDDKGRLICK